MHITLHDTLGHFDPSAFLALLLSIFCTSFRQVCKGAKSCRSYIRWRSTLRVKLTQSLSGQIKVSQQRVKSNNSIGLMSKCNFREDQAFLEFSSIIQIFFYSIYSIDSVTRQMFLLSWAILASFFVHLPNDFFFTRWKWESRSAYIVSKLWIHWQDEYATVLALIKHLQGLVNLMFGDNFFHPLEKPVPRIPFHFESLNSHNWGRARESNIDHRFCSVSF